MKALYAYFNEIVNQATHGKITIHECITLMENAIEEYNNQYLRKLETCPEEDTQKIIDVFYINKYKAYHRMFKLLFELTKGN